MRTEHRSEPVAGVIGQLAAQVLVAVLLSGASLLAVPARAAIALADQPLTTTAAVPGNLLLSLSVEYPTALSLAYPLATNPYTGATAYLGYFDPAKCYAYQYNASQANQSYFEPYGAAISHACSSTASQPLWSGSWLNWASMQTIDAFRWALTGGYRAVDLADTTILEKAWASGQGGTSETPNKSIAGNAGIDVTSATPFSFGTLKSRIYGLGNRLWVTGTGNVDGSASVAYVGQTSQANPQTVYELYVRLKACNATVGIESNCSRYGSNYKPEGLMQQYATRIRYGAFGYLNDSNINRDGGVLRARMKFVGPVVVTPGQPDSANLNGEWDAINGVFGRNPDIADAAASSVLDSGVLNYLNKFGNYARIYKTFDPIAELYYAGVRYFKNQGNVASYSSLGAASSIAQRNTWVDGFPVITTWDDPILYSCQKNFILGIGDVNTHRDANLPGSTIRGNEPAMPPEVAADTTVNVTTATNMVGTLEGLANLGTTFAPNGTQNTYFMAGLAYDSHVKDIRPNDFTANNVDGAGNKISIQTISTYWLDVQEYQSYTPNNSYYLATKYGGFKIPSRFSPYAATNAKDTLTIGAGTTPLTDAMWHTTTDINGNGSNKRPDNYYGAGQADKMISGLQNAFASIASQISGGTTAFSFTSPRVTTTNNRSYAAQYDAATWSGNVGGGTVSYDLNDNPSITQNWNAQALLENNGSRKIITCCTATGAGLPFQVANLTAGGLNGRTNYASFAQVPGVLPTAQSAPNFLAYLRGDRTRETNRTNGVYRTRTYLLGDIVNAKLAAIGPPSAPFDDAANPGYSAFKSSTANRNRTTVVYAGANDGMLHAFDGAVSGSTMGSELFAYIPSFVYGTNTSAPVSGLASLGQPSFTHHFFVDQTPGVFDIDMGSAGGATGASDWRSLLIGGLGKGGKGYYAIDVTSPASWSDETALASKVKWEFTDPDMGYSYGDANVVKTKKYGWVVILTSGYNNVDGVGYFFIVNPVNGALLEKISTGYGSVASPAGMTHATAYVIDYSDGTADALYAGDLNGNVWRLDLTPAAAAYSAPVRLAQVTAADNTPQAITSRPLIEVQPITQKRYVLFGTGRLLDGSDLVSSQKQSLYAIVDGTKTAFHTSTSLPTGVTFPVRRSNLVANTNALAGIGSSPSAPMGWYIDLMLTSNGASERMTVTPTANFGIVAFAVNLPNGDACNASGSNRKIAVSIGTGQSVLVDNAGAVVATTASEGGLATDIAFINLNGKIKLQAGNDQLVVKNIPGTFNADGAVRQLNWRELPTPN